MIAATSAFGGQTGHSAGWPRLPVLTRSRPSCLFARPRGQMPSRLTLGCDAHRKCCVTVHKIGKYALGHADHFNLLVEPPVQDFFPNDPELHFCETIADAAMNAEPKRDVVARVLA